MALCFLSPSVVRPHHAENREPTGTPQADRESGETDMADTPAALAETYGADWHVWRSRHGGFACATRRRELTWREISNGLSPTLVEPTVEALAARLAEQAKCETRVAS